MGNISIFVGDTYLRPAEGMPGTLYLARASRLIRGNQVAEILGAKLNPTGGYENDVCIYVKPKNLDGIKDGAYVDVMDNQYDLVDKLKERPNVNVIAYSGHSFKYLCNKLTNKVVIIPEHHCNFERERRDRKEFLVGGYIGSPSLVTDRINQKIGEQLEKMGLKFTPFYNYHNRQDVVDFYKTIDFQVIGDFPGDKNNPFAHPNKIINAASFGIPTIAAPKPGYEEFERGYIHLTDLEINVDELRGNYDEFSDRIFSAAETYHIERIAKLYYAIETLKNL